MIASMFIKNNIVDNLALNFPVYLGAGIESRDTYFYTLDVGGNSNPAYLRDTYVVKYYGVFNDLDVEAGSEDMNKIKENVLGHPNIVDADDNVWCLFLLRQAPLFIGKDDVGRLMWTMEFEVTKDGQTGVHRRPIN